MGVKVSDLFPEKTFIPINGVNVELHPLSLTQIIHLLTIYRQDLIIMFADSAEGSLNLVSLVATAPVMAADIIAFGINAEDQIADIRDLPGFTQVELLAGVWAASVPDPKKLMSLLSGAMAGLQKVGISPSLEQEPDSTPPDTTLETLPEAVPESTT